MSLENLEVWKNFIPSKSEIECENSKNGHSFIAYKKVYYRCYLCGKIIDRRF